MFRFRNIILPLLISLILFSACQIGIYFYIYPKYISFDREIVSSLGLLSSLFDQPKKSISINLYNKVLATFEDAKLAKIYKIAAAGHPRISPTPKGYFKVLSKSRNIFSGLSKVWMPWSLRFYKNYFIHEVPYYPSGQKVQTRYSLGCIRLSEEIAQEIYNWAQVGTKVNIYEAQLIKTADDPRIYYLTKEGSKRHIPSPRVFFSYGYKPEDVVTAEPAELDAYPDITLIRAEGDYKVYKLENNIKRWIKTAETFDALGYNWDEIYLVNFIELGSFPTGENIE